MAVSPTCGDCTVSTPVGCSTVCVGHRARAGLHGQTLATPHRTSSTARRTLTRDQRAVARSHHAPRRTVTRASCRWRSGLTASPFRGSPSSTLCRALGAQPYARDSRPCIGQPESRGSLGRIAVQPPSLRRACCDTAQQSDGDRPQSRGATSSPDARTESATRVQGARAYKLSPWRVDTASKGNGSLGFPASCERTTSPRPRTRLRTSCIASTRNARSVRVLQYSLVIRAGL
jgi:hypothetical protein